MGLTCEKHGAVDCESCDDGYHQRALAPGLQADNLSSGAESKQFECALNECKCAHGKAAVGKKCPQTGEPKCESCDEQAGFSLTEDSLCEKRKCLCEHGEAAVGQACPKTGDAKCVKCDKGYLLDEEDGICKEPESKTLSLQTGKATWIGCFKDDKSRSMKRYIGNQMTVEGCKAACSHYDYFAIQYGTECRCANKFEFAKYVEQGPDQKYGKASTFDCKLCEEDKALKPSDPKAKWCGGGWRNSVYEHKRDVEYVGCYKDTGDRALKMVGWSETLETCADKCSKANYDYFALQWGTQCGCGNGMDKKKHGDKIDDGKCNHKGAPACKGGANFKYCGGGWSNAVYQYIGTDQDAPLPACEKKNGWRCVNDIAVKYFQTPMNYKNAMRTCWSYGAVLAKVNEQEENEVLQYLVPRKRRNVYIAASDVQTGKQFIWADGEVVPDDDPAWNKGEPNNWRNKEDCTERKPNGKWNDIACFGKRDFVCSKPREVGKSMLDLEKKEVTLVTGKATHLGCFGDDKHRAIKRYHGRGLTLASCKAQCSHYDYFAIQANHFCFCANKGFWDTSVPKYQDVPPTECAFCWKPVGTTRERDVDPEQGYKCGSGWRNSVYQHEPDVEYVGCFQDKPARALKMVSWNADFDYCADRCAKTGSKFFALQWGNQCGCGQTEEDHKKFGARLPDEKCHVPHRKCNHNSDFKYCGGGWTNAVYRFKANKDRPDADKSVTIPSCKDDSDWRCAGDLAYKYFPYTLNFNQAMDYCMSFGATVATVKSKWQNEVVRALSGKLTQPYIGANDKNTERQFVWPGDGSLVSQTYSSWNRGEPNDWRKSEDCTAVRRAGDGLTWNDLTCNSRRDFVCSKPIETPEPPVLELAVGSVKYLGCFKDNGKRNLKRYQGNGHTVESCKVQCQSYDLFAVQNGSECFCGNKNFVKLRERPAYPEAPLTDCRACKANDKTFCGGGWRNSVYEHEPNVEFLGCFKDKPKRAMKMQFPGGKNLEECMDICSSYDYFALQWGDQCACGNGDMKDKYGKVSDQKCTVGHRRCKDNAFFDRCGGGWTNAVYRYKDVDPASVGGRPGGNNMLQVEHQETISITSEQEHEKLSQDPLLTSLDDEDKSKSISTTGHLQEDQEDLLPVVALDAARREATAARNEKAATEGPATVSMLPCSKGWRCPADDDQFAYKFFSEKKNFNDALRTCFQYGGGSLATVLSESVNQKLSYLAGNNGALIGYNDKDLEGVWQWADRGLANVLPKIKFRKLHDDKYCKKDGKNYRIAHDTGTNAWNKKGKQAPWSSRQLCEKACADDGRCNFYLWRFDAKAKKKYVCARFRKCGKGVKAFSDGDGGSIWEKVTAVEGNAGGKKNAPEEFTNWKKREPNNWGNSNREDCTVRKSGGKWNDINCNAKRSFICSKPNLDGTAEQTEPSASMLLHTVAGVVEHKGCFKDNRQRNLKRQLGSGFDLVSCKIACQNYNFFALQNGSECRCGNQGFVALPTQGDSSNHKYAQAPAFECKPCERNNLYKLEETGFCGAGWRNSVYEHQPVLKYVGCFRDRPQRAMPHWPKGAHTVDSCMDACLQHKSGKFKYFALQWGNQCFCAETMEQVTKYGKKLDDNQCTAGHRKCKDGALFKRCGGGWSNAVYEFEPKTEDETGKEPQIRPCRNGLQCIDHTAYKFVNKKLNFKKANAYCAKEFGASLATIATEKQNELTNHLLHGFRYNERAKVAIGLNDKQKEKKHVWFEHGDVAEWKNWEHKEPNNWRNEDCAIKQYPASDGKWFDIGCNSKHPFLCSKPECPTCRCEKPAQLRDYHIKRIEVSGGDWTTASCPAGYKIIGGGCNSEKRPWRLRYNAPEGDRAWKCGGHGGKKRAYAICVKDEDLELQVIEKSGGDWTVLDCPRGTRMVNGGCDAHKRPWRFEDSVSSGNGWKCGGQGGAKKVFAICTPELEIPIVNMFNLARDWVTATCPKSYKMIGGGCDVVKHPHILQKHGVKNKNKYQCGGHGSQKRAYATCLRNVVEEGSSLLMMQEPAQKALLDPPTEGTNIEGRARGAALHTLTDATKRLQAAAHANNVASHESHSSSAVENEATRSSSQLANAAAQNFLLENSSYSAAAGSGSRSGVSVSSEVIKTKAENEETLTANRANLLYRYFLFRDLQQKKNYAQQRSVGSSSTAAHATCPNCPSCPPLPAKTKYNIKRISSTGGDWHKVECPANYSPIGGGCDNTRPPHIVQMSAPDGRGWKCGGHGGKKKVWVVCIPDHELKVKIVSQRGGDWFRKQCPKNTKVIGGGCNNEKRPWRIEDSIPEENGWRCGGSGGKKRTYAICTPELDLPVTIVNKWGNDWATAWCPEKYTLIGGGCNVQGGKWIFSWNGPDNNRSAYKCGGHGGWKEAYAICMLAEKY
ncbi:unnamed protein product [Amoebophrya sp. A120]|nr:unnamed protein product [Amoebophrya sp. A120]|eukprot:GSA120T00006352001.1